MTLPAMVATALQFATKAHGDQIRKYTGEPYIVHPIEVMMLVKNHVEDHTTDMLVAALLHDVVEDTPATLAEVTNLFGWGVGLLVADLTDMYTHEAFPHENRAFRKVRETARLSVTSPAVQTIKYADIISNVRDIEKHDPKFAAVFVGERANLLQNMQNGDPVLRAMALETCIPQPEGAITFEENCHVNP